MNSIKTKKVGSLISRELSSIILEESRDSILKNIVITGCDVSHDLSFAKVYFTSLINMDIPKLEKELNEATKFLRIELSKRIELRHTPAIKFIYDKSIAYGENIENIINELHKDKTNK